jgi:hypothetical protein
LLPIILAIANDLALMISEYSGNRFLDADPIMAGTDYSKFDSGEMPNGDGEQRQ